MKITETAQNFRIVGDIISCEIYGDGHINRTYLLVTSKKRYILQKINTALFTEPDKLMANISAVTEYLRATRPDKQTLTIVPTLQGETYYSDETGAYRVFDFIEGAQAYSSASKELFAASATAFGAFADDLSGFNASVLYEVLPRFHDTVKRLADFKAAVKEDKVNRVKDVKDEIEWFLSHAVYADMLTSRLADGRLPLKVTHNDTKLNNVMISPSGEPVAVIDLDTVMPGTVCYDFGDSIRFGCNTAAEDEPDLDKVHFSLDYYYAYYDAYVAAYPKMTAEEKKMLPFGAIIMTYECGMRFLTDYLCGDTYFRCTRKCQNLDRAHTQMRLVDEMIDNLAAMSRR